MSFRTALSGLNAAATDLQVIGNNIANASTTGFKQSRAEFASIYATSNQATGATAESGAGARVAAISQQFGQGQITFTDNNLDLAISGSGFFRHGPTSLGHAGACAAALAVQQVIEREGLLGKVQRDAALLQQLLTERLGSNPHVGDIRGRGFFWGVELVQDRASKAPFDPARRLHAKVKAAAFARGLLVYPMGGTVDGRYGDHVLLAPPFIATTEELTRIVSLLAEALDAAIAEG